MLTVERTTSTSEHRLRRELAQLRAENKFLRESLPMKNRYSRIIANAQADAIELIESRWTSERTSKSFAFNNMGMSERRWYWAVALLRYAGVIALGIQKDGLDFVVDLRSDALARLNNSATDLISEPGGYRALRRLLPRSRRR